VQGEGNGSLQFFGEDLLQLLSLLFSNDREP
jgi:hypothetical protein